MNKIASASRVSPSVRRIALSEAQNILNEKKNSFLQTFDSHEVTQELADPNSVSSEYPSLRGFMGFEPGDKPAEQVRNVFIEQINLNSNYNVIPDGKTLNFVFPVNLPTANDIYAETPSSDLQWNLGKSWAKAIDTFIPGFERFAFWKAPKGRSLGGIQVKSDTPSGSSGVFTIRPWVSQLVKILRGKFQRRGSGGKFI